MIGLAIGAVLFLANCSGPTGVSAPPSMVAEPAAAETAADSQSGRAATSKSFTNQRPGLGTGWGDEVRSSLANTRFTRASNKPIGGIATIYYNDRDGVEAMAGRYKNKTGAFQSAADGTVEWAIKSGWGYPDHYMAGSRRYVVGKKGKEYSIFVRNQSEGRLEVVLSVDGLDVMDGKGASFKKRGYIIEPGESLEVEGFRTSYDTLAAFKFSGVSTSYSNLRHNTTRDVGVIGLAVFAEKGRGPWRWSRDEIKSRDSARPFAEAPPRTVW